MEEEKSDFVDQVSVSFDVDPTEIDVISLDDRDITKEPGFKYPALLLCNVEFKDILRVIQAYRKPSYRMVDVWLDIEGGYQCIGDIQLSSDTLLLFRRLKLKVLLYLQEDSVQAIDFEDAEFLERFV